MPDEIRAIDSKGKIKLVQPLDKCIQNVKLLDVAKKSNPKLPATVTFRPGADDYKIIEAGKSKHGLKKTVDVIRMALRRFAEAEGMKAS
jgi:hypothetical protein